MYLVVDAQALQAADVRNRGIGRYTGELIHALTAARPGWRIEAVVNAAMPLPERAALSESIQGLWLAILPDSLRHVR